jgi:pimeloyl-ACP methyl ester carboxylesterase
MNQLCWLSALATLAASSLLAQDISGIWQGTLKAGAQELRLILEVSKGNGGGWQATMYSIDQTTNKIPVSSITLDGPQVKFAVDVVGGSFDGKLAADGASMTGTWTQRQQLPLELRRVSKEEEWAKDPTPHSIQFVTVDKDVKLEVLDWGGTGRPLVLLTGLGDNAHRYDKFALKLTPNYHVYGITRRGFGASSAPATGYSADRLGDDVLAVLDALKLTKPILVGHSIGGEELSSVGSRHPEKVAGLVYLDAGYSYAFYDRSRGDLTLDVYDVQKKLALLEPGKLPQDARPLVQELLETSLPALEKDLRELQKNLQDQPPPSAPQKTPPAMPAPSRGILEGGQKYTQIRVPVLAIFAVPHLPPDPVIAKDPAKLAAFDARDEATTGAQAKAFEAGVPTAHVVRLPHANHYVFLSNEADVLREINAFVGGLPQ